jgi:hypothetical protein
MKFNWGYKILFVYLAFVAGILFLAFKSSTQKFDLVQQDYYADELKYQNVIDAKAHAKLEGGDLTTSINNGHLIIQLPATFNTVMVKGNAHLYFAADETKDLSKNFNSTNAQIDMELLTKMKGNYTLKLAFEKLGVSYYYEQKIIL